MPRPGSLRSTRHHNRAESWSQRLVTALTTDHHIRDHTRESKVPAEPDDRVWYDQFTSTDWVHDSIADAYRLKALRSRTDIRGRIKAFFDGTQGWILSALVGCLTATIAYAVDKSEAPVFDWKDGYCSKGFFLSEKACSLGISFHPFLVLSFESPRFCSLRVVTLHSVSLALCRPFCICKGTPKHIGVDTKYPSFSVNSRCDIRHN